VGGVTRNSALERGIEATLRRDYVIVAASLAALIALAWVFLWLDARHMAGLSAPQMPAFNAGHAAATFLMWTIMMVGMMLPSTAPTTLLYAALVRKNGERGSVLAPTWVFVGGYLAAWTGFSVGATALQIGLEQMALLTPMQASSSTALSAAIFIAAGIYQWLPLKQACLKKCQQPLQFLMMHWRVGVRGAFHMGAQHGAYCIGCCWALMLLLFVAGVMNLLWVTLLALFVLIEKLVPTSRLFSNLAAVVLLGTGLLLALGSS
jgi:predicted metal-binding membrane protein